MFATLSFAAGAADLVRAEPQSVSTSRPSSSTARGKAPRPRFTEHQVAAGTTLPIQLQTRLSSNANRAADGIEGRLLRPLTTRDGLELVPAGAVVSGTVSEAEPAGLKQRGRLAFTFHVVEHPETGSRAMIKASVLTFESEIPAKGNLFAEVRLEKGSDASVLLLAPLLVAHSRELSLVPFAGRGCSWTVAATRVPREKSRRFIGTSFAFPVRRRR